jgi:hypothetical protein
MREFKDKDEPDDGEISPERRSISDISVTQTLQKA